MTRLEYAESPRAVALGYVPDSYYVDKFGRNADVDAATAPEDIWEGGGLYTGQPVGVAETVSVVSSSTADTAAGTGLRTLYLGGLDADYGFQVDTVTLNGTTPVVTTKTWSRIGRVYGLPAGSGGSNAGTITVRHSITASNVFAAIQPGYSQTEIAAATIPAGYVGLLTKDTVAALNNQQSAQQVTVGVLSRARDSGCWRVRRSIIVSTVQPAVDEQSGGTVFTAGTDMVFRALGATADNIQMVCRFDLLLFPDLNSRLPAA